MDPQGLPLQRPPYWYYPLLLSPVAVPVATGALLLQVGPNPVIIAGLVAAGAVGLGITGLWRCEGIRRAKKVGQRPRKATPTAQPPRYIIDLDLPPERRWDEVVQDYAHLSAELNNWLLAQKVQHFGWVGTLLVSAWLHIGPALHFHCHLPPAFVKELKSIAKVTQHHGLPFSALLAFNLGYDYTAHCTSAVVQATPASHPVHLRTLDWDDTTGLMRELTITAEFRRNGKPVFVATTWAFYIGCITGMHVDPRAETHVSATDIPGSYSLSLNFRLTDKSLAGNVLRGVTAYWPAAFALRQLLEVESTFDEAVEAATSTQLIAPAYLVLAGPLPGQGVVLERDPHAVHRALWLRQSAPDDASSALTTCATNIDADKDYADPKWADGDPLLLNAVERRTTFHDSATKFDDADIDAAFRTLLVEPVHNYQTVYATVMSPGKGWSVTRWPTHSRAAMPETS